LELALVPVLALAPELVPAWLVLAPVLELELVMGLVLVPVLALELPWRMPLPSLLPVLTPQISPTTFQIFWFSCFSSRLF
jgi:hypothetical protein